MSYACLMNGTSLITSKSAISSSVSTGKLFAFVAGAPAALSSLGSQKCYKEHHAGCEKDGGTDNITKGIDNMNINK